MQPALAGYRLSRRIGEGRRSTVWLAQGRRAEASRRYAIFRTRTLREFGEEPEFQLADLRPAARTTR